LSKRLLISRLWTLDENRFQLRESLAQGKGDSALLSKLVPLVPRCCPNTLLAPNAYVYKQATKLDARAKHASKTQYAVAMPKPAQDGGRVRDLAPSKVINHRDMQEHRVRLSDDAVHHVAEFCIHTVVSGGQADLGLDVLRRHRQGAADCTETSNGMDRKVQLGCGLLQVVWGGKLAAELAVVGVPCVLEVRSLLTALGQPMQRQDPDRHAMQLLTRERPVIVLVEACRLLVVRAVLLTRDGRARCRSYGVDIKGTALNVGNGWLRLVGWAPERPRHLPAAFVSQRVRLSLLAVTGMVQFWDLRRDPHLGRFEDVAGSAVEERKVELRRKIDGTEVEADTLCAR